MIGIGSIAAIVFYNQYCGRGQKSTICEYVQYLLGEASLVRGIDENPVK